MWTGQQRPVRARRTPRRRAARRNVWVPPGRSAAAGVVTDLSILADAFDAESLRGIWNDIGATPVSTGSGLVMAPRIGAYSRVELRAPGSLIGKTVAWQWAFDPSTFKYESTEISVRIIDRDTAFEQVSLTLHWDGSDWVMSTSIGNSFPFTSDDVTTDGSEWRYVRVTSDFFASGQVTVYRSANGTSWTTVGSKTFADAYDIDNIQVVMTAAGLADGPVGPPGTILDSATGWVTTGDTNIINGFLDLGGTTGAGTGSYDYPFDFFWGVVTATVDEDPTNTGTRSFAMRLYRNADSEYVEIGRNTSNQLYCGTTNYPGGGGWHIVGTYSRATDVHMRLRQTGTTVHFETSPDGDYGTWTSRASMPWSDLLGGDGIGFDGIKFSFSSTVATDLLSVYQINP